MQLNYVVQRQKFMELLSWQGGGEQRMAFPPWKPLERSKIDNSQADKVEMEVLLQQLSYLKGLCSTTVSHKHPIYVNT